MAKTLVHNDMQLLFLRSSGTEALSDASKLEFIVFISDFLL